MDSSEILNFIIDEDEFVSEEELNKLESIMKQDDESKIKKSLEIFFKDNYPSLKDDFLIKFFQEEKASKEQETIIQSFEPRVVIKKSFEKSSSKRTYADFAKYFSVRFKTMEKMLRSRTELTGLTSISRVKGKTDKEEVSIIAMVLDKYLTKNNHYILTLEDYTGSIKVLVNKDNPELMELAEDIVLDEVVAVSGTANGDIIFSKSLLFPDVPLSKELKKSPYDHYAVFLGDPHFGSNVFLKNEFAKFLSWLNGNVGNATQREIAKKVKYVFLTGDLVEGVGIYPSQENDLDVVDIKDQYALFTDYLKKIPSHMKIIVIPGNHDTGRIAEPQLPLDKEYSEELCKMKNVILLSNPSMVSIDVTDEFSGIDVMLYHGYSLIYYSDAVPRIRSAGGQKAVDLILQFLMKRRHLAPTHGSTLYVPDTFEDPLAIEDVPDILATGHIHRASSSNYHNVTLLNCSCWTDITEDQEKRGLEPQPGRVPVVHLKTREVRMMNFFSRKDAKSVAESNFYKKEEAEKKTI